MQNPANLHYYILVSTNVNFADALALSLSFTYLYFSSPRGNFLIVMRYSGKTGYLATITTADESDWITTHFYDNPAFWISGASLDSTGYWSWQGTPDQSQVFYNSKNSSCVPGEYRNFRLQEFFSTMKKKNTLHHFEKLKIL